ncbi:MAG: class I SAM-dependent methyltransferase [Ignavibacteriales bacterium]
MLETQKIFLPGTGEQLRLLLQDIDIEGMSVVVFGSNSERIAKLLALSSGSTVDLIVEDFQSLLSSELYLKGVPQVRVRMMAFDATDFENNSFDMVYAQGAVSVEGRERIVKEVKRILKPGGYLCSGEVVILSENPPRYVCDIWNNSGLDPRPYYEIDEYYKQKQFNVLHTHDLGYTMDKFYQMSSETLKKSLPAMSDEEKSYNKKLINRMSHESNVYLKQGGKKYMGFKSLLLQVQK